MSDVLYADELLSFNNILPVHFSNGTIVARSAEVKYLGCYLNDRVDPKIELRRRIGIAMASWKAP
eukprot:5967353-Prorocentrum_lima.AAC.1